MDLSLTSFYILLFLVLVICPIIFALVVTSLIKKSNSESVKLLEEIRDLLKKDNYQ